MGGANQTELQLVLTQYSPTIHCRACVCDKSLAVLGNLVAELKCSHDALLFHSLCFVSLHSENVNISHAALQHEAGAATLQTCSSM